MEALTDNINGNAILNNPVVPGALVIYPKKVQKPIRTRFAKNPLLWMAVTWLAICVMLVLEVWGR